MGRISGYRKAQAGVLAFFCILAERKVLIVANTNAKQQSQGWVVVDFDLGRSAPTMRVAYSNLRTMGNGTVKWSRKHSFIRTMALWIPRRQRTCLSWSSRS